MSGHADHFCGYPCMARAAVSDTEVVEDHDFDGTCITCGTPLPSMDAPREVEIPSRPSPHDLAQGVPVILTAIENHRRYILRTLRACGGEIALADLKAGSGRNAGRPHFGMALDQLEREGLVRCVVVQGQTLVART